MLTAREVLTIVDQISSNSYNEGKFDQHMYEFRDKNPEIFFHLWTINGKSLSLSGLLIERQSPDNNLEIFILGVLKEQERIKNFGSQFGSMDFHPVHQALALGHVQLAERIIYELPDAFKNRARERDSEGRTLLSYAITCKKAKLLEYLLFECKVNPMEASNCTVNGEMKSALPPIHQAALENWSEGIALLTHKDLAIKADLSAGYGDDANTPLHISILNSCYAALHALIQSISGAKKILEIQTKSQKTAVDLAADNLNHAVSVSARQEAMQSIIALICHGATIPVRGETESILCSNRDLLLQELKAYLCQEENASLAESLYQRVSDANSKLHAIIYGNHTLGDHLSYLIGNPREAAYEFEAIYSRAKALERQSSNQSAEVVFEGLSDNEKFSLFVARYEEAYSTQCFKNPWSTMRWKIASGEIRSWVDVKDYADSHPRTRTAMIYRDLVEKQEDIHMQEKTDAVAVDMDNIPTSERSPTP